MASGGGTAAEAYDFRNPSKFTRDHQRIFEHILETFSDQTGGMITSRLRTSCSHELESIQQFTYGAFINTLPEETVVLIAGLSPLNSAGVIHVPLELAMLTVDLPLGGPGEDDQPARGLTDIEEALVGDFGQSLIGALRYSFDGITNWIPSLRGQFSSPELAHAAAPNDQMLVATFRLEMKERQFRTALALPLGPILPSLDAALAARLAERSTTDQAAFKISVEKRLQLAPVLVSVRLRPTQGRLSDFTSLAPGDVFRLGHPKDAPWEVTSSGVVFAHALPGGEGTQAAFRVV
jgi:flagellar motor switch protein FliM